MNIHIDDPITDAIAMASPDDWIDFFEAMRQQEFQKLRAVTGSEELTRLQARVTLIDELEQFVVSARQNPKPTK